MNVYEFDDDVSRFAEKVDRNDYEEMGNGILKLKENDCEGEILTDHINAPEK